MTCSVSDISNCELMKEITSFLFHHLGLQVSFVFAAAIDDNARVSVRAARVRKGYEGQGIYKKMRQYCMMNLPTKANTMLLTVSP